MRLVNIKTLQLEEYHEGGVPPYAALSHRWTSEELSFKEVYKSRIDATKQGYRKLVAACQKAADYGVEHLWNDTCCIDKRSSAELSEAINSMFAIYENSSVCLAYLEDVKAGADFDITFRESVWFRRAWTLQELIAPQSVEFFDRGWELLGNKTSNAEVIARITGISADVLDRSCPLPAVPIIQKMSWAAGRVASRSEDVAYSLLGLFNINMPPLYGEGSRAFFRLQQQIMQHANDLTFLLWGKQNVIEEGQPRLLAYSPDDFLQARNQGITNLFRHNPMSVTNLGIEMDVHLVKRGMHLHAILIGNAADDRESQLALLVRQAVGSETYYRVGIITINGYRHTSLEANKKLLVSWGSDLDEYQLSGRTYFPKYGFVIDTEPPVSIGPVHIGPFSTPVRDMAILYAVESRHRVKVEFGNSAAHMVSIMECRIREQSAVYIQLTFDFDSNPVARFHNIYNRSGGRWHPEAALKPFGDWTPTVNKDPDARPESRIAISCSPRTGRTWGLLVADGKYPYGYDTVAKVPGDLLPFQCELWVSFVRPNSKSDSLPGWWTFRISTQEP